jgi:hypothetical protein
MAFAMITVFGAQADETNDRGLSEYGWCQWIASGTLVKVVPKIGKSPLVRSLGCILSVIQSNLMKKFRATGSV